MNDTIPSPPTKGLPPHLAAEPSEGNSLGMAGFVVSLVSLFLCGLPAIIGLLLSLVGLGKQPRGFALAGVFISFLALLEMVAFGLFLYATFMAVDTFSTQGQDLLTEITLAGQSKQIAQEWETSGELPDETAGQQLLKGVQDTRGQEIQYETDGSTFSLRSPGRDGEMNTDDDVTVGPFGSPQEVRDYIPKRTGIERMPPEMRQELEAELGGSFQEFEAELQEAMREQQEAMEEMQRKLNQDLQDKLPQDEDRVPQG